MYIVIHLLVNSLVLILTTVARWLDNCWFALDT